MEYKTEKYEMAPLSETTKKIDEMILNGWAIFSQSYVDMFTYITFVKSFKL